MSPKVSILMGIYNCETTLTDSIDSIINQSYKNWELIICDDCSVDSSYDIAMKYGEEYKNKIIVLKNEKNLTLGPTLNKCLKIANGKYIARHDGDDTCNLNKLEIQVKFLDNHEYIDLVGTAMNCFDENGIYGVRKLKSEPLGKDLMSGTTFAHATIMMKKQVMKDLDGYSENPRCKGVEDYDLWFRFFHNGHRGYNIDKPLYNVREDRNSYKRKDYKRRINEIRTMYDGRELLGLNLSYNKFLIKPIIAAIMPTKMLMKYHRRKVDKDKEVNQQSKDN